MTLEVDLVEFRAAYLAEMDELTVAAEEAWSALGEAFDEGRPAVSHVRDLLRAVHTMKGISAMMNAEPTVELAHELEELLRAIDGGGVALADVHVGLAREALRGIAERLAETREGRNGAKVPEAFLASLREAAEAAWPPERAAPFAATPPRDVEGFEKLEAHERARLDEAASSAGMRAVRISFVPSPEKAAAGLTIGKSASGSPNGWTSSASCRRRPGASRPPAGSRSSSSGRPRPTTTCSPPSSARAAR